MNDEIAIKVDHVSKTFKLPHEKAGSVKSILVNFAKRKKGYEIQRALNDISFEVKKGEFFGIVGRNGSGKSTLLKMLAGIYTPTKGNIQVNGKLTPFIELGVGFNPELTGRENVFLNGALLGFSRKEMAAMYDDIVEFAELEKFMDQKLKNYSSGMQVRLAFSIAIKAKNEFLILDEVLAVGDEAFQYKCTRVFEQYKAQKQTIILVTHDMSVVERFCSRALMLREGEIVDIGTPRAIADKYSEANKEAYTDELRRKEEESLKDSLQIATLDSETLKPKKRFIQGETATIKLSWKRKDVKHVGVALMKQSGEYIFGPNTYQDDYALKQGRSSILYTIKLNVGEGEYFVKAGLFSDKTSETLEFVDVGPALRVEKSRDNGAWGGVAFLEHKWSQPE